MEGKWAYSELSKKAKEHGGPEGLVKDIKEEAYQEGRESRDSDVIMAGVMGGLIVTSILSAGAWVRGRIQQRKEERIKQAQKAKEAEVKLIEELEKETKEETGENEDS